MEALGNVAGMGFSAKPQVISQRPGPYRDPYRDYM